MHEVATNKFTYDVLDTDDMHIENCTLVDLLHAQECGLNFENMHWNLQDIKMEISCDNARLTNEDYNASICATGVLMSFNCPHLPWVIKNTFIYTEELLFKYDIDGRRLNGYFVWYAGFQYEVDCKSGKMVVNDTKVTLSRVFSSVDYSKLQVIGITDDNLLRIKFRDWFSLESINITFSVDGKCRIYCGRSKVTVGGKKVSKAATKRSLMLQQIG